MMTKNTRKVIRYSLMECTSGTSNKFYEVSLIYDGKLYHLKTRWGRRTGKWETSGGRTEYKQIYSSTKVVPNSNYEAHRMFKNTVRTKLSRGYKEIRNKVMTKEPEAEKKLTTKENKILRDDPSLERFTMIDF